MEIQTCDDDDDDDDDDDVNDDDDNDGGDDISYAFLCFPLPSDEIKLLLLLLSL